jgi:inhibitor of nuclear factor kappa-B kinase subunit alpha
VAVSARSIVVLAHFKETVDCESYVQAILEQFFPELTEEEKLCDWFQQDSATAHTARTSVSVQALSDVVGKNRIISSGIWQARSPDLNPCDFFFWGCLKDEIYNSNPRAEEELKGNNHKEISNIPAEQLQKVNQNLFRPCEECLRIKGQHFEHLWSVNFN